jgi:hypothetical protein
MQRDRGIEALGKLLRLWRARSDIPSLDPGVVLGSPDLPTGIRLAARMLTRLAGRPGESGGDDSDISIAIEGAVADIASETELFDNRRRLEASVRLLENAPDAKTARRALWLAFCPDVADLDVDWAESVNEVRGARELSEVELAAEPIAPAGILLTANVLLTVPASTEALPRNEAEASLVAQGEEPSHWFDHPIPLDTPPSRHEAVHGLKALDEAVAFECGRGVLSAPVPIVLSASTTHDALESTSSDHVRRILGGVSLDHLDVRVFDEAAATALFDAALAPALNSLGRAEEAGRRVVGVSGPYGRHYTFLKAIAAFWSVLLDANIRATFKIDLDQVFPQERLVADAGRSAFELLAADAWGGAALDRSGTPVSLGFVAGALVNEGDIADGLHVPDVPNPGPPSRPEDMVFYPSLPQAVSTEAEMTGGDDGAFRQRVHVTGGTTGATVQVLRGARPFSPSFWGRAEDQVFALSTWRERARPVSLHVPGLVMRHDNSTFRTDSIPSGVIAKLIGDHERILMFSAYGRVLDPTLQSVKKALWPYTGVFMSTMPATVSYIRLAVTALSWASDGRVADAEELFTEGIRRLDRVRRFTSRRGRFAERLAADRQGWDDVYNALDALGAGLASRQPWALRARRAAVDVFESTRLQGP